jgi:hypothetical protein
MSWQFRVEDMYVMCGELTGMYHEAAGGKPGGTMKAFKKYYMKAVSKGLMPAWWESDSKTQEKFWKTATTDIMFAIEKSDIVDKFGYSSNEHIVLRSLAAAITGYEFGSFGNLQRVGDAHESSEEEEEEDSDFDEDDDDEEDDEEEEEEEEEGSYEESYDEEEEVEEGNVVGG